MRNREYESPEISYFSFVGCVAEVILRMSKVGYLAAQARQWLAPLLSPGTTTTPRPGGQASGTHSRLYAGYWIVCNSDWRIRLLACTVRRCDWRGDSRTPAVAGRTGLPWLLAASYSWRRAEGQPSQDRMSSVRLWPPGNVSAGRPRVTDPFSCTGIANCPLPQGAIPATSIQESLRPAYTDGVRPERRLHRANQ
jgi:hypothetical protein